MTRRREQAQAPQSSRRAARDLAFRVLFEAAQGGTPIAETLTRVEAEGEVSLAGEARDFARSLVLGYEAGREEVDGALRGTIRGWSFAQMAQTDLNVLRLAVYELLHGDQPAPVVIESAVRLARKYGGEESGKFVNGVLGSFGRTRGPEPTREPELVEEPEA